MPFRFLVLFGKPGELLGNRREALDVCRQMAVLPLVVASLGLAGFYLLDREHFVSPDESLLATERIEFEPETLRPGDLMFRRGRSITSRAVLIADPESPFSHVGLIVEKDERLWVVHAMPGNGDGSGRVRRESVESFLAPENAVSAAVLRASVEDPELARKAAEIAIHLVEDRVLFDENFDLADSARLYCTELVWIAYRRVGLDLVPSGFDRLSFPLEGTKDYILPSTLYSSSYLEPVAFVKSISAIERGGSLP